MSGNLHFESIMLFFLVCALYKLTQKKWRFAGVLIAGSISVKLIPFLFLPLFYQWFTKPKNLENKLEQINDKSSNGLQRKKGNLSFTGIKKFNCLLWYYIRHNNRPILTILFARINFQLFNISWFMVSEI
ncbi:hypothetical protein N8471_04070 [Polaribacter sp.]|nr:hypothetical protein [Polaribacter sp.]